MRLLPILLLFFLTSIAVAQDRASLLRKLALDPQSKTVLVAAHRASHLAHPENSLSAIRDAIRLGVDLIEIDAKCTADGVVILMHDGTINRTTTGKGNPEKMKWSELQNLFLVADGRTTAERIPTLEEALLTIKGHALVDLDMKTDNVEAVLEVVRRTGMEDFVLFFDSDRDVLKKIQAAGKFMVMPRARDLPSTREVAQLFSPPIVHIDPSFHSPEVTQFIQEKGSRIWINTLGSVDQLISKGQGLDKIRSLVTTGINVIQTDQPQLLIGLLDQLGSRPDLPPILNEREQTVPSITAHRGKLKRKDADNTIATFQKALGEGVDFIEVDVRTTKDGEMVIVHDGTLKSPSHTTGRVDQMTLQQLMAGKSNRRAIPTLEEVADLVASWNAKNQKATHLYVDCKSVDPLKLFTTLKKYNLHKEAIYYGSDEMLLALRAIDSEARIIPALRSMETLNERVARLRPFAFDVNWKVLDAASVRSIQAYHVEVFTDLLAISDHAKNYKAAKSLGVNGIQTDRARKAKKVLF
jgi:glycerophosphoryl diester phosphodiesterase